MLKIRVDNIYLCVCIVHHSMKLHKWHPALTHRNNSTVEIHKGNNHGVNLGNNTETFDSF